MSYAAVFEKMHTVTAQLQIRIRRPINVGEPLSLAGSITKRTRKLIEAKGTIFLKDGTIAAEANATQFVISAQQEKQ